MNGFEIEKKYLVNPDTKIELPVISNKVSMRGYISLDPEVRITQVMTKYSKKKEKLSHKLTIKGEGELIRKEVNINITPDYFMILATLMKGQFVTKHSTVYKLDDKHEMIDNIVECQNGPTFRYAEIEFETEEEANAYTLPFDIGQDVTSLPEYKMKNYWEAYCSVKDRKEPNNERTD